MSGSLLKQLSENARAALAVAAAAHRINFKVLGVIAVVVAVSPRPAVSASDFRHAEVGQFAAIDRPANGYTGTLAEVLVLAVAREAAIQDARFERPDAAVDAGWKLLAHSGGPLEHVGPKLFCRHSSGALDGSAAISRNLALTPVANHALTDADGLCQSAYPASIGNGLS